MCKRWPGCPDEIRRSRIGSFCTSVGTRMFQKEQSPEKKWSSKHHMEKIKQAHCKRKHNLTRTHCKRTREQSETLLLKSYSYTKNGALKVWMKLWACAAFYREAALRPQSSPCGNGLLSGLVARVSGGQPGQRAVPPIGIKLWICLHSDLRKVSYALGDRKRYCSKRLLDESPAPGAVKHPLSVRQI
jgi:hypothetical protein